MAIAVRPGAVRRSRALAIAFAAVIVCGACGDPEASAQITGFRQGADPQQLVLTVMTGLNAVPLGGYALGQDASGVTVEVRVRLKQGTFPAIGVMHEASVNLTEPLGTRTVRDQDGREIPRTSP